MLSLTGARRKWRNWSGTVRSTPKEIVFPENVDDVIKAVKQSARAGRPVRVAGSGHSFTPLVSCDEVLISLDRLQGLDEVDAGRGTVTVWAGTKLKRLGRLLFQKDLAQENLGDIDAQSIAGAIATGTHGTGIQFGSLSTQVTEIQFVTAAGELAVCSAESHAEWFKAMQVSLGLLGVIVKVKLKVVPAFKVRYQSRRVPLRECLQQLETLKREHRHFEFYWFPHTDVAQVKCMDQTEAPLSRTRAFHHLNRLLLENGAFWLLSASCRIFPRLCQPVSRLSAKAVPVSVEVGFSRRQFVTPRLVRFQEMEYNVPAENMRAVLEEVQMSIEQQQFAVHFPIECRYVKGDDIWLSPAYGRDSAYIAVHMFKGMPYEPYFTHIEKIFWRYGGRPHWGKWHTLRADRLSGLYPKWHDFLRVREVLDPDGLFLNDYLRDLFGLPIARSSPVGV